MGYELGRRKFLENILEIGVYSNIGYHLKLEGDKEDKIGDYLTDKGELKESLLLIISQEGFAGTSLEKITIERAGKYEINYFVNEKILDDKITWKLGKKTLKEIAEKLSNENFSTLPEKFGKNPLKVNSRKITVQFGKTKKMLVLHPTTKEELVRKGNIPEKPPEYIKEEEKELYSRFLNIANYIYSQTHTGIKFQ